MLQFGVMYVALRLYVTVWCYVRSIKAVCYSLVLCT
jgi:hypothetical protein